VGLVSNRIIDYDVQIGLWEVTEDYETLLRITYLNDDDMQRLDNFKNINRKIESLSVRTLLQRMTHPKARIIYKNNSRKPFVADGSHNISISHSHNYTGILLSKEKKVGIDIEHMSHKIELLAHKFINEREKITDDPLKRRTHLYIHWCAKEALYKICDKEEINFQEHLTIEHFDLDTQGCIKGVVKNDSRNEEYKICYLLDNEYVIAYCAK